MKSTVAIMARGLAAMLSLFAVAEVFAAEGDPFSDAAAVWHFSAVKEQLQRSPILTVEGSVEVGVPLQDEDRLASLLRGGDGRVARFEGGYLSASQAVAKCLGERCQQFSFCVRLRDSSGRWLAPLVAQHGGHDKLTFNLFSAELGQVKQLGFELGTERTQGMTQVSVPLALIGETDWHDIVCRYNGAKLQLFIDGVWLDEGFPIGPLRLNKDEPLLFGAESLAGAVKSGWHGEMDHAALWSRALTDGEIETLSGGQRRVDDCRNRYIGATPSMQYFRPFNQFHVGDTFPFFRDGVFRFYYLLDRGHHTSKGNRGAHQWAQASSRDLIDWKTEPLAIELTREDEGSICTGSVFFHDKTYYGFYATRTVDNGEQLSLAVSGDGVRFTKAEPNPLLSRSSRYTKDFRDPFVFVDEETGLFNLVISTLLVEGRRGCLARFTSGDLTQWKEVEPLLIEGTEVPECPDHFKWKDWYYLLYSNGGVARYRMARRPLGPWTKPEADIIDGAQARVMKTAAFTGERRIGTVFLAPHGYAGYAVFRELIQHDDGTLGSAFVKEMIPATGKPALLIPDDTAADPAHTPSSIRLSSEKVSRAALTGLPANGRLSAQIDAKADCFTLELGGSEPDQAGIQFRFSPKQGTVSIVGGPQLAFVKQLAGPFEIDLIFKDQILDLSIGSDRTLIAWAPHARGNRLSLTIENGQAVVQDLTVSSLK